MNKVVVYNSTGEKVKDLNLSSEIFTQTVKPLVIKQVVEAILNNQRVPWAHTKGRSEVRGGGRKPWRQKGTGRARHGSIRSPLWIGGGVTFGPNKQRSHKQKVNKKMRTAAWQMALSDHLANQTLFVIDKFDLSEMKTRRMLEILAKLPLSAKSTLIILDKMQLIVKKASANLPTVKVVTLSGLNILDLLTYHNTLFTEPALAQLEKDKMNKK